MSREAATPVLAPVARGGGANRTDASREAAYPVRTAYFFCSGLSRFPPGIGGQPSDCPWFSATAFS